MGCYLLNEVLIGNNVRVGPKLPDEELVRGGIVTGGSAGHQTNYVPVALTPMLFVSEMIFMPDKY